MANSTSDTSLHASSVTGDTGFNRILAAGIVTAAFWLAAAVTCSLSMHRIWDRSEVAGSLERWLYPPKRTLCGIFLVWSLSCLIFDMWWMSGRIATTSPLMLQQVLAEGFCRPWCYVLIVLFMVVQPSDVVRFSLLVKEWEREQRKQAAARENNNGNDDEELEENTVDEENGDGKKKPSQRQQQQNVSDNDEFDNLGPSASQSSYSSTVFSPNSNNNSINNNNNSAVAATFSSAAGAAAAGAAAARVATLNERYNNSRAGASSGSVSGETTGSHSSVSSTRSGGARRPNPFGAVVLTNKSTMGVSVLDLFDAGWEHLLGFRIVLIMLVLFLLLFVVVAIVDVSHSGSEPTHDCRVSAPASVAHVCLMWLDDATPNERAFIFQSPALFDGFSWALGTVFCLVWGFYAFWRIAEKSNAPAQQRFNVVYIIIGALTALRVFMVSMLLLPSFRRAPGPYLGLRSAGNVLDAMFVIVVVFHFSRWRREKPREMVLDLL